MADHTDELRSMLRGRCLWHKDVDTDTERLTFWNSPDGYPYSYATHPGDMEEETFGTGTLRHVTPQQAIAATVGIHDKLSEDMPAYDGMYYEELVAHAQFLWLENRKLGEYLKMAAEVIDAAVIRGYKAHPSSVRRMHDTLRELGIEV